MSRPAQPSRALAALVVCLACGDEPAAPAVARFSGRYVLRSVNGTAPPVKVSTTIRNDREMVDGTITIRGGGELTETRVFRWVSKATGAPAIPQAISGEYAYVERGDTLIIRRTIAEFVFEDTATLVAPGELSLTVRRLEAGNSATFVLRYAAP